MGYPQKIKSPVVGGPKRFLRELLQFAQERQPSLLVDDAHICI